MSPSVRHVIAWVLQAALALLFIKAGFDKLSNLDGTMKMFGSMGLPGWFTYLIGGAELLGGIGLLVPRTVRMAAQGLLVIMAGTVIMHATVLPGGMAKGGPALVFLLLLVALFRLRRPVPLVA